LKKKKIVLDSGNGTAGNVAPELFKLLGADVVSLFGVLDGNFPNHHPDPTVSGNLKHLIAAVKKERADFGIAFDGDSDRIGVIDENGKILYGDELLVLFSRDILSENKGATIISEVKCSHRLFNDITSRGGRGIMWKAGHSVIKSKMKEEGALLAGEMSGHVFFADRYFGFDDAIYAALRVYEIASKTDQLFSALLSDLPPSVSTPEIRVDCIEEKKFELAERVKNLLKKLPYPVNDIDGVRIDFGDGWGLLRASNTQPALVLRFEAPTTERLEEIRKTVEAALVKATEAIGHPKINARPGP
jgi:phosphomannomutase/phosphoglucomutase